MWLLALLAVIFPPSIDITKELSSPFDLQLQVNANMHIKIHEDNLGALALRKLESRRMTNDSEV
jgi:hypothetical protein